MFKYWVSFLSLLLIWGCASSPVSLTPADLPQLEQPITLRVLDSQDRPLIGARLVITPLAGQNKTAAALLTDQQGEVNFVWLPLVQVLATRGSQRDHLYTYLSSMDYQVELAGFEPLRGRLDASARGRRLSSPELARLNTEAMLSPMTRTVVMRKKDDLLGPRLQQQTEARALKDACLEFYEENRTVAKELGVSFSWPAFEISPEGLAISLDWQGASWSGLGDAPLLAQATVSAGLPMSLLLGEELAPLIRTETISLNIKNDMPPDEKDPYATPVRAVVDITAPRMVYIALAQGEISADEFLLLYPPALRLGESVAAPTFSSDVLFPEKGEDNQPAAQPK